MTRTATRPGPGFIVAAAFVGPGTVTACTLTGVAHGMTLLWVLLFAVAATILLQEMSARLALTSGKGLAEALSALAPPWGRCAAWLTGVAVVLGVVAFEAGNLSGAGLGLAAVGGLSPAAWTAVVAVVAAALLLTGSYRLIEGVLVACVALMGLVFVVTAVAVGPALMELLTGLLVPRLPDAGVLPALALVGTTIVPYNVYLYASVVRERWAGPDAWPAARRDLVRAVIVGGIISAAIVITAAAALRGAEVASAAAMARQLEPVLGEWARLCFGAGFAIAGLTSAVTAPLAAAYVVTGLAGVEARLSGRLARAVMLACLATGAAFALGNVRPVELIFLAQAANGIILPLIALALLAALNDRSRLGIQANGWVANSLGLVVVLLCGALTVRVLTG